MEKKKSPSIRSRAKKYDFETPLNPFEGESLKGIAAFIESSLTLQSPPPLAPGTNGGPQDQSHPENLTSADSSCSPQYHPITASSADSDAVSSTSAADTINTATDIEIGTPNTAKQHLGDIRRRSGITEPLAGANETGIMSKPITESNERQDSFEIGTLITNSWKLGSNEQLPPPSQRGTDPRCEPNFGETGSSDDRISKIASLSDHAGAETQDVLGTLRSSIPASPGNEAKHDSPAPTFETPESLIIGIHNSDVPSIPIIDGLTTTNESPLRNGDGRSTSILGVPNSFVSSTPVTSESAANDRSVEHGTEPIESAILGTPKLGISSTPTHILYLRIHPAVRGQDGLNKGEEKIYTFLWRTTYRSKEMGKPEFRTEGSNIEISLRDLARKVGLGLANCAWHMHCLEEKGCIARVQETDHYHPAVYYVREFGQILEWRKEHGLTHFIQRGHLAAFVDPQTGVPITRFRGQTSTIYRGKFVSSTPSTSDGRVLNTRELSKPNTIYSVLNSTPGGGINSSTPSVIDSNTQLKKVITRELKSEDQYASTSGDTPVELITLLHNISPTIDHEAAVLLWNECRARVTDCTVEEVLYFTGAKASILEPSKIRNPIGFLLAAVPKCFEGEMFNIFRRDQARRQEETLKRETEERSQALRFEHEAQREAETYRMAEERLAALSQEEHKTLYEQIKTELRTKHPQLRWPDRQALEDRIRLGMIRELQKQLLVEH